MKDIHTQLVLGLLLRILVMSNSQHHAEAVSTGQYSGYESQSNYPQSSSYYGNENHNYFDNPGGGEDPVNRYSGLSQQQQRQQFPSTSYGAQNFYDNDDETNPFQQQQDSFQPQSTYEDYLTSQFGQIQESALSSFGQQFGQFNSNEKGQQFGQFNSNEKGRTSSFVTFDNFENFGFNNSEATNYQANQEATFPSAANQQYQQQLEEQSRQQFFKGADFMTAGNYVPPVSASLMNSLQLFKDKGIPTNAGTFSAVASNKPPNSPKATPTGVYQQAHGKPFTQGDNQQRNQLDQQHTPRKDQSQPRAQHQAQFGAQHTIQNDKQSQNAPTRTFYVADSDLQPANSSSNHPPDAQPLSLFHSHLIELATASSSYPGSAPATDSAFNNIPGEAIPISKHVEITKHVPVPVYRQIHVPFRKPVRIEIPRSVISTVPRPYPFQIPTITKTVAVPRVKEVKIPIEKVTPYPVEHKVPYVVEKRVPFQVEKQVAAPIYYPFPVRVPMVRTILHKAKAHLPPLQYRPRVHI